MLGSFASPVRARPTGPGRVDRSPPGRGRAEAGEAPGRAGEGETRGVSRSAVCGKGRKGSPGRGQGREGGGRQRLSKWGPGRG